ncbi:uncharacterized protein VTP21DRAFT_2418 [Calcarisporiella thermophila]|uniref:uncharacterized protein n=1 Tax=Calcarisporiella thermophila TaxID=911321 RepID=UPI0037444F03
MPGETSLDLDVGTALQQDTDESKTKAIFIVENHEVTSDEGLESSMPMDADLSDEGDYGEEDDSDDLQGRDIMLGEANYYNMSASHSLASSSVGSPWPIESGYSRSYNQYDDLIPGTSAENKNYSDYLDFENLESTKETAASNPSYLDAINSNVSDLNHKILQIRVLGVPQQGAKSRVETQTKLAIHLANDKGEKVDGSWTHIKLPEIMIAKQKLTLKHSKNAKQMQSPLGEKGILTMEAAVLCASGVAKKVVTCVGCVRRERKRAQRKKPRPPKPDAAPDKFQNMDEESLLAYEQQRILLFNCPEVVPFESGEIILPTRITCYCRHHNEKVGFIISFQLRDHLGRIVARGTSPPILITDDHKSSRSGKEKEHRKQRRRVRASEQNYSPPIHDTPSTIKPEAISGPATPNTPMSPQVMLSPVSPLSPSSLTLMTPLSESGGTMFESSGFGPGSPGSTHGHQNSPPSSIASQLEQADQQQQSQLQQSTSPPVQQIRSRNSHLLYQRGSPYSYVNGVTFNLPQSQQLQQHQQQHQLLQQKRTSQRRHLSEGQRRGSRVAAGMVAPAQSASIQTSPTPYINPLQVDPRDLLSHPIPAPVISKLIPDEGPLLGGIEVTILGSGFYQGLTCLFGETPSFSTQIWGPGTIVCLLPPSPMPGPVIVSFKEHPLTLADTSQSLFFTYKDESTDRQLMELALQVLNVKLTGRMENAREIAMRIVSSGHDFGLGRGLLDPSDGSGGTGRSVSSSGTRDRHRCETNILHALFSARSYSTPYSLDVSLRNRRKHTMLHFCAVLNLERLARALVQDLGARINVKDRNGFTPLHYAAWMGHKSIVRILVDGGAKVEVKNEGKQMPIDLARSRCFHEIVAILREQDSRILSPNGSPPTQNDIMAVSSDEEDDSEWDEEFDEEEDLDYSESEPSDIGDLSYESDVTGEVEGEEGGLILENVETAGIQPVADVNISKSMSVEESVAEKKKQAFVDVAAATAWLQKTLSHLNTSSIPHLHMPNIKQTSFNVPWQSIVAAQASLPSFPSLPFNLPANLGGRRFARGNSGTGTRRPSGERRPVADDGKWGKEWDGYSADVDAGKFSEATACSSADELQDRSLKAVRNGGASPAYYSSPTTNASLRRPTSNPSTSVNPSSSNRTGCSLESTHALHSPAAYESPASDAEDKQATTVREERSLLRLNDKRLLLFWAPLLLIMLAVLLFQFLQGHPRVAAWLLQRLQVNPLVVN